MWSMWRAETGRQPRSDSDQPGQEKDMECRLGGQALASHLSGDSVTTLVI
jgi:hypothetical protein